MFVHKRWKTIPTTKTAGKVHGVVKISLCVYIDLNSVGLPICFGTKVFMALWHFQGAFESMIWQ